MAIGYIPYLTSRDYISAIQKGQLSDQLLDALEDGEAERRDAEIWAMDCVDGKIGEKFDLDFEFTPTLPFDPNETYGAYDRCIIDFPDWISATDYLNGQSCVIKDGYGYICLMDNNDIAFDLSKWQNIGAKYQIYYIDYPFPLFNYEIQERRGIVIDGYYSTGDIVWWAGHTYRCKVGTIVPDRVQMVQFETYAEMPSSNVFPNDKINGQYYWEDLGLYQVNGEYPTAQNNDPTVPVFWKSGDNRYSMMVMAVVDIAIWILHKRISPQNIPLMRTANFERQCKWLNEINRGDARAKLVKIQPSDARGGISWGSNVKVKNGYT